jgi:hypothetical protein
LASGCRVTTAFFKLEPGTIVPLHEHTALEQTYVIRGSLENHEDGCAQSRGAAWPFSQAQSFRFAHQHEAISISAVGT